jgi:hypothetical protein
MLEFKGSIEIIVSSLQVLSKASFLTYDNAAFSMPTGVESCIDPAPVGVLVLGKVLAPSSRSGSVC